MILYIQSFINNTPYKQSKVTFATRKSTLSVLANLWKPIAELDSDV